VGTDRRRTKARQIGVQVQQGIEFLETAEGSSLLTKPLTLFYAAENLVKALCIYLDADADLSIFGAHGLNGEGDGKRYFIRKLSCEVGHRGSNVWTNLLRIFNADRYNIALTQDGQNTLQDVVNVYPTPRLIRGALLQLSSLLRHLPEMADDVVLAGWEQPYVVHCPSVRFVHVTGPQEATTLAFTARHGHNQQVKAMVLGQQANILRGYTCTRDTLDVLDFTSTVAAPRWLRYPSARLDVFGETYFDFYSGQCELGELALYYAALFILSDAVRYKADQWLRLLDSHPAEAILIERFCDIAVRKLPNLVLNELHQELFMFKFAR
jgi:hypothetical protein